MKLSIVATLYRSAPHITEFYQRVSAAAKQLVGEDYEIVLVHDGSPDNSLGLAVDLTKTDEHVIVIDLSRNFGHHQAMMTGLEHACGDLIFLIDSDLEEEPEWLQLFSEAMAVENADVIYGRQEQRKGGRFERWSGNLFYSIFNWLCNIEHPKNIVTARLMTARYVKALLLYQERQLVMSCLWVITGFKQCERTVKKHSHSQTTYSLSKKIEHAVNAVTSFSDRPLKLIFYVGMSFFLAAISYACYLIFLRLFLDRAVDGWTSVMVSVWVLSGLIISFIGIIGIYLAKIFIETKQRPLSIIRTIYGRAGS